MLAMRSSCRVSRKGVEGFSKFGAQTYHKQGPEGVVEEDDRGGHKHGDAHEFVKLRTWRENGLAHARLGGRI